MGQWEQIVLWEECSANTQSCAASRAWGELRAGLGQVWYHPEMCTHTWHVLGCNTGESFQGRCLWKHPLAHGWETSREQKPVAARGIMYLGKEPLNRFIQKNLELHSVITEVSRAAAASACWCSDHTSGLFLLLGPEWCLSHKTCHLQFAFCWGSLCAHTRSADLPGAEPASSANQYSAGLAARSRAIDYLWEVTPPGWHFALPCLCLPSTPTAGSQQGRVLG